jgi:hypothetical protein
MKFIFLTLGIISILAACSPLPNPSIVRKSAATGDAAALLRKSAIRHGDPWKNAKRVTVEYSGDWSKIAPRLQPVLTDTGFRKSSVEIYQPPLNRVIQLHTGPFGKKQVIRQKGKISVTRNGTADQNPESLDAAALVADAYTAFLFGPSWLLDRSSDLKMLESKTLGGEVCDLVAGKISPGFGVAKEDDFIVWISQQSGLMLRFQFSLNGLETTRGADVDVVFSDFKTTSNGFVLPQSFIERIQRPIYAPAHRWTMTSVKVE